MSGVINPRGPLPPGVYWVRRIVAVLVVIALLLAARWVILRFTGSGTPVAGPTTSPSTSTTPTPTPTPSPSPSASKPSTSPSTSKSPSASSSTRACADNEIRVTASTDAASYVVGSTPKLRMRIQNVSSTPCTRDLGSLANELVITSGKVHVWSSDDCNPGGKADVQTMQPDQSFSVTVTWLGRLSAKGCPTGEPYAQPGSYQLVGRNGAVSSAPATFALTQG